MAPRADSLGDLRALDRRLSEVAPGAHLERRILGRLRGEAVSAKDRGFGQRTRRPALVLSFALVAAVAVLLVVEARDVSPVVPPSAAGPRVPEARDLDEVLPEANPSEPIAPFAPGMGENENEKERTPRSPSIEEDGTQSRRAPDGQPAPVLREGVRPQAPRFFGAPDAPDATKVNPWPGAPEGSAPAKPQWTPRAPGTSSAGAGSYGSMLYPQGSGSGGPESRSTRLFGTRRSSPSIPGEMDPPASSGRPPATPWEAPEEAPTTCENLSTWKEIAHKECDAEGLVLVNLVPLDECGEGMFGGVEAVCAAPANDPSDEPPPGYCVGVAVGDGTTCEPPDHWKLFAEKTCSADGLVVFELHFSQDCGDGLSTMAKVLCCDEVAPPDPNPPSPCVTFEMAPACSPAAEVEADAKAQCAGKGLSATEMKLIPDCPNGGISYAAVLCCP